MEPGRWYSALRAWARDAPGQADYAEELAGLYGAYRDALARLGRTDPALHAIGALDALRLAPARWGGTPVFLYGFDDLTAPQRDAVETLAVHCGAELTVSLAYEPGRAAFAGRGATFQELLALGAEHVALPARREGAGPPGAAARHAAPALRAIERGLLEAGAPRTDPGDAVLLLEGGGERAELELVAAHVARLIRERGYAPEEIAVVLRAPDEHAPLLHHVFADAGVPIAIDRRLPAGHTALGRGLIGLLRCALGDASADDLLAWLRTPGMLTRPALADRLEADARRTGAASAAAARELWEQAHPGFALDEIDRDRERARARGGRAVRAARGRDRGAVRRAVARSGARADRCRGARRARRRRAARGAGRARCAGRAPARPGALARRPRARARAARGARWRARGPRRRRGHIASAHPRAPRARALPLPAAGGRVPAPGAPGAVPRRCRAPRAQRGVGNPARPARGRSSTPSATSSTPRSRGRPTCSPWRGTPPTTRASPRCARCSSTTCSTCWRPSPRPSAVRWAPRASTVRWRRTSVSGCAPGWPSRARRGASRRRRSPRWPTRSCSPRCARARRGRPRRSRRGAAARSSGSSSACSPRRRWRPTPSRCCAASSPTRCSRRPCATSSPTAAA